MLNNNINHKLSEEILENRKYSLRKFVDEAIEKLFRRLQLKSLKGSTPSRLLFSLPRAYLRARWQTRFTCRNLKVSRKSLNRSINYSNARTSMLITHPRINNSSTHTTHVSSKRSQATFHSREVPRNFVT